LNNKISDKDKKDWEDFLTSNNTLNDKDANSEIKKTNKIISYDLHGYSLDEANRKIKDLIINAYNQRINKLIIVTGKGLHSQNDKDPYVSKEFGILKNSVPNYIKSNSELMNMINSIQEASIEDGGSGAFYIYLKKKLIK
tara:strand:- start:206 stop:625 length:420 start_codon:yes stop_codon:yes gene_type:complete